MTNDCTPTDDTSLRPNIDQASKHLEILDEVADTFTFQTFDESGQKRPELTRLQHGTLDQHWDELVELNSAGAGIFVAVGTY